MSQWRREASQRLPELQGIIASPTVNTPAQLWIELENEFDRLCRQEPAPTDLLLRIWQYAKWSANHKDEAVQWAAISLFFENLKDTKRHREVLPRFMPLHEYEQVTLGRRSEEEPPL